MELKISPRRTLAVLIALGAALALVLALSYGGASAKAAVNHHRHAAHHARKASDPPTTTNNSGTQSGAAGTNGTDTESQAPEGENSSGVDPDGPGGPDAGGDHQCPPACSPGEQG